MLRLAVLVALGVRLRPGVHVTVGVTLILGLRLELKLVVAVVDRVVEGLNRGVLVMDPVIVVVGVTLVLPLVDGLIDIEGVSEADRLELGLTLELLVIVAVTDQDLPGVDEGDSEGLTDVDTEVEGLMDEDIEAEEEVDSVGVTVRVRLIVGVLVPEPVTDTLADTDVDGLKEVDGELLGDDDGVTDGVTVRDFVTELETVADAV